MAIVPAIRRLGAGDVRSFTSARQTATEARGLEGPGRALVASGENIQRQAGAMAEMGVVNQRRDNVREVDSRILGFQQKVHDLTYGNPAENRTGYKSLRGQAAIDAKPEFDRAVEEARLKAGEGVSNSDVAEAFTLQSQKYKLQTQATHGAFLEQQRFVAEEAMISARIEFNVNTIVSDPQNTAANRSSELQIVADTLRLADLNGHTDPLLRLTLTQNALTAAHQAAINTLLDRGDVVGAEAYYELNKSEIVAKEKGDILKSLEAGSILQESQTAFDKIVALNLSDTELMQAARDIENPKVRKEVVQMARGYLLERKREEQIKEKELVTQATNIAYDGKWYLPETQGGPSPEQKNAAARSVGRLAQLQRINDHALTGRPYISDPEVRAEAWALYLKEPETFNSIDWNEPKWLKLSLKDRDKFQSYQRQQTREEKAASAKEKKARERQVRVSNIRRATRDLLKSFDLDDQGNADLMTAMADEAARLADLGVELTDDKIRDMARAFYLMGEATGTGIFDEDDIRAFKAAISAGEIPFNMKDFTDTKEYKTLLDETELPEAELQETISFVVGQGMAPTTGVVLRQKAIMDVAGEQALTTMKREMDPRFHPKGTTVFAVVNSKLLSKLDGELGGAIGPKDLAWVVMRLSALGRPATASKVLEAYELEVAHKLKQKQKKKITEDPPVPVPTEDPPVPDEQELKEREEQEAEIAASEAERARLIAAGEPTANEELITEQDQIISDEGGNVAETYSDEVVQPDGSIRRVPTGGVGHRLTAAELKLYPVGTHIPQSVRDAWFKQDMQSAVADATSLLPKNVPPQVFNIVVNMAFNMGKPTLSGFGGMFTAIRAADYDRAALEMEWIDPSNRSKGHTPWFNQTGRRAKRLIARMRKIADG